MALNYYNQKTITDDSECFLMRIEICMALNYNQKTIIDDSEYIFIWIFSNLCISELS